MNSAGSTSQLYFGMCQRCCLRLMLLNLLRFFRISANLNVGRHGGRHQDAGLIRDFDGEHE
jgi:hypothetical protein